jgi:hypothetical protein
MDILFVRNLVNVLKGYFLRLMQNIKQKGPTIVLIKDLKGYVFGAFCS